MVTVYAGVDHRLKRLVPPGGNTVPSVGQTEERTNSGAIAVCVKTA